MADFAGSNAPVWLSFGEFVSRIADKCGAQPRTSELQAVWENGPYQVCLSQKPDGLHVEYLVDGSMKWQFVTGTIEIAVEIIAKEAAAFLNGPQPPRRPPEKLAANEQRIEAIQKRLRYVQQAVHHLMNHRRWHLVYAEIVKRNSSLMSQDNPALHHLGTLYQDYAVLGVRRQIKWDKDSYSLVDVMHSVRDAANEITREWHHRLWRGETKSPHQGVGVGGVMVDRMADETFDQFAGAESQRVDPLIVQKDLDDLVAATRAVVDYADRMAAHSDRRGFDRTVYTEEQLNLDRAIETVELFTYRYSKLLFALAPPEMTPVAFEPSLRIFRDAWIKSEDELNDISRTFNFWRVNMPS